MSHNKRKLIVLHILTSFFLFIFILAVLEVFMRLISPPNIFHPALTLKPHVRMELEGNLRGVSGSGIFSTNKWGMRGDEPPKGWSKYYTIVTIGGSTTQCFYLDDHKTWPYLLQFKMKQRCPFVWIGNGGLDGQSTRAHIIFMKYVIANIRPKAVILLVGFNDLALSINDDFRLYGSFFEKVNWKRWIFSHSRLVQVLYFWKAIIFEKVFWVKTTAPENFNPQPLNNVKLTSYTNLRELLPSLDEYGRNIREIIRIGRSLGVRVIFLTQPSLIDDNEYWSGKEGKFFWIKKYKYNLPAATYWKMLDIFNKELLRICKEENIEIFDLASEIPHNEKYFYDYAHFTEAGSELVADKVGGFILKSGCPDLKLNEPGRRE